MENKIQDVVTGLGGQTPQVNPEGALQTPGPVFTGQTPPAPIAMPFVPARPKKRRIGLIIGSIVLVLLLITAALLGIFFRPQPNAQQQATSQFNTVQIPLDDFLTGDGLALIGTRNLTINGRLEANDAFIISPSGQPTNATAGQIYFDQTSSELGYFNGTDFVQLPGDIPVGTGITNTDGQLANSGVLSLQGQVGAVTITSGGGIAVDGTTLTNTGVLSLGGATGELTVGNGLTLTGNELSNSGVNSLTSGTVSLIVTNDGAGNLTISDVGGGTGTVTSSGGTAGRIAKFTGVQNIEDSLLSESGTTITVNGDLTVTGTTTLTNPLTVGNGGTGATSLASNGVVISHGASAFTSVAAGGAGLCFLSTVGAPAWGACPGSGGVTSLNSLTGALTLANSTGVGTTVTIDDASTAQKGIARFNATNFSALGGIINTIQNIDTTASPTFASQTLTGDLAVNGGDITSSGALNITPGGTLTVGATSQTLTLQGGATTTLSATSGANATTVRFESPTANVTYRLPTAAGGTYDVCSTAGNCSGVGGGVTTAGGTINRLAKFTAAQGIGNSTISDDGANVTTTVDLIIQGGDVTVGVASTQTGTINLAHSASGFLGSITQGPLTGNRTYTLPDSNGEVCLTSGNCSGTGSSNTLQAAYAAGNIITTTDARDIDIVLANTTTDSNLDLVVADGSTSFVSFARANGAGTSDPAQMLLVDNLDTDRALPIGIKLQSAAGGMTTGIDASDAELVTAISVGDNTISGGLANIDLTNFDVVGSTGNITTAGDLAVNGSDITSSGPLNLNSGSTIELQDATNVSGNLTVVGTAPSALIVRASTNGSSALALDIQQSDTDSIMRLTDNGTLGIGNSSGIAGIVALSSGTAFAEVRATNITAGRVLQLPNQDGTFCVSNGSTTNCETTLQRAYNASTGSTTPEIKLDTTRNGIEIQDADSTIGSGQNFISLRGPNAGGLGNVLFGVGTQGNLFMSPSTNRTDLVDINQNGGGNVFTIDSLTSTGRVGIALTGTTNPSYTLDIGGDTNLASGSTFRINGSAICTSSGCTAAAGSTNYIQNQILGAQTASNFWISTTGRADTSLLTPLIDTASAGILSIGLSTATTINLGTGTGVQSISLGTGATGAKTTTLGSTASTSTTVLQGGTGTATGDINIGDQTTAGKVLDIGSVTNAGTGTVNIATASGAAQTVSIGSTGTGSSLALNAGSGNATLNATAGSVTLQTTTSGAINIKPAAADGTNIVLGTVDNIGTVLVLDEKTGSGDPSAVAGGMYYNSNMARMRCYYDSAWRYCNEPASLSLGYNITDDFVGWDNSTVLGERSWGRDVSGTGATVGGQNAEAGRPGVLELETGTATTVARAAVYLNAMNHEPILISGGEEIEFAINIPTLADGTNDFNVRAGLCDNTDGTDCNSGIYIEYDRDTSANWIYATSNVDGAGSRTKTTSSTAVTTGWHRFKIVVNSAASSISYFMDGASLGSAIASQIPTTTTQPAFVIAKDNPTGAATRLLRADYFQIRNNVTSPR